MSVLGSSLAEWRTGWKVVFSGCVGTGTGYGMFLMSAGLFIKPMQDELGWSTSTIAIAPMVLVIAALLSPLGGAIIDRFGARRVAITGLSLFGLAYIAMDLMPMHLSTLYLMVGVFGIIGPLSGPAVFTKGVAGWFRHSMGAAFGMTMSGVSFVALLSLPLVAHIIERFGWRAGYLGLAGIVFVLGLPTVITLFRERKKVLAPQPLLDAPAEGVPLRDALKDRRFWLYLTAFTVAAMPMGAFMTHIQPLMMNKGFDTLNAANYGVVYALGISVGRVTVGMLLDRFWASGVASVCFAVPAVGALYLSGLGFDSNAWLLFVAVLSLGLSHGAEADFLAYFTTRLFGLKAYSTIFGIQAMTTALGLAVGGIVFSALFDYFLNYVFASQLASLFYMVAAILVLMAGFYDLHVRKRAGYRSTGGKCEQGSIGSSVSSQCPE